ncbi:MAG: HEAT repeat domain-containing protein [Calothrix sp. C42_A2020_038]|nr:HEAT repeat domain-containing protein [Calothrix sp. C42_A2020_038]
MKNLVKQSLMVFKNWQLRNSLRDNTADSNLSQIGQDKQAVWSLIAALKDEHQRYDAVIALGNLGKTAEVAAPALIELLHEGDATLRINTIESLCKIGSEAKTIPSLITALEDSSKQVRATAAFALGCFQAKARIAVEPLIISLQDSDEWVRAKAVEALSHIRDPKATIPLIIALNDEYPGVRAKAALALPNIASPNVAVPALIAALIDKDARVRAAVADALGMFGPESIIVSVETAPVLINALEDSDLYVQINAAKALIKIGLHIEKSMNVLMEMLEKEDVSVRVTTALNLGIISVYFQDKANYLSVLELEQIIYNLETVSYLLETDNNLDAAQFALFSVNNTLSLLKKERKNRNA